MYLKLKLGERTDTTGGMVVVIFPLYFILQTSNNQANRFQAGSSCCTEYCSLHRDFFLLLPTSPHSPSSPNTPPPSTSLWVFLISSLNPWFSCLSFPNVVITGMQPYTWFFLYHLLVCARFSYMCLWFVFIYVCMFPWGITEDLPSSALRQDLQLSMELANSACLATQLALVILSPDLVPWDYRYITMHTQLKCGPQGSEL